MAPIAREEWDFSVCPQDELNFCRFYEYAREKRSVTEEIADSRSRNEWTSGLYPGDDIYFRKEYILRFFELLPEFPGTPWLKIKPEVRKKACEACENLVGPFIDAGPERIFAAAHETGEDGLPVGEDFDYPYYPMDVGTFSFRSVHVVEIDWCWPDSTIRNEFEKFLERSRKIAPIKETRGGRTKSDVLKSLGAYRLVRHFSENTAEEVIEYACKECPGWYEEATSLTDAAKKAKNLIDHGVIFGIAAALIDTIAESDLDRVEKAKLKIHVGSLKRAAARKIARLEGQARLDAIVESFRGKPQNR